MPLIKPPECFSCPLENIGQGFSRPDGIGTSRVAIIGEALGHDELLDGLPFRPHAQSGSKLDQCIKLAGEELGIPLTRNHFLLYNIIACNPPGDRLAHTHYEHAAINHCEKNFSKIIPFKRVGTIQSNVNRNTHNNIRVILGLGNIPLRTLAQVSGDAKDKQSISHLRGYILHAQKYGIPVVSSYHPSFIKRGNGNYTPYLVEEIKRAIRVANGEITNYPSNVNYTRPNYIESPSLDTAWSYYNRLRDNVNLPISYDIETPHSAQTDEETREDEIKLLAGHNISEEKEIIQIQFSCNENEGIALPFKDKYIDVIRAILELPNTKYGFNCWSFDDPRIIAHSLKIAGISHDVMVMFAKWQPNLERGLQKVASLFNFPFPWKHLFGSKLQFYGCADAASVIWIINRMIPLMKTFEEGKVWSHYTEQVYNLKPVLDYASDLGVPVNEEKRIALKEILEKRKEKYLEELQSEVPDEIKGLEPKRKNNNTRITEYGFKRTPREIIEAEDIYIQLSEHLKATGNSKPVSFRRFVKRKYGLVLRQFGEIGINGDIVRTQRWCRQNPFNPSSKQVVDYLNWKRESLANSDNDDERELAEEYEVPKNFKTGKDTTGKKELQEIFDKTGDVVLDKSLRIRSLTTNITNYIPNWKPDNDGRVHTEWGFLQPQEQLSTKSPNIQNCSKHTEIGQEFRGIIEAPDGYEFGEMDKKSFHVATMGYCANDPTYIRFSQLDPHSIFTSYIHPEFKSKPVDFSWSDSDILSYCKDIKRYSKKEKETGGTYGVDLRQDLAKPCVLGNQLGLGPKKLWFQNRKVIKSIAHAKELQAKLAEIFPKVEEFKEWCIRTADNQGYLITDFGDIQWFYDIYSWTYNKKKLKWEQHRTDVAEKCLAKMVQATAFGMIKNELLKCWELGYCEKYGFVNTIHDSLQFCYKKELRDNWLADVGGIMNAPCGRLVNEATGRDGLIVKVEASVGRNWKNYDEKSNPEGMREI